LLIIIVFLLLPYINPKSLIIYLIFDNDTVNDFVTKKLSQVYNIKVNKKQKLGLESISDIFFLFLGIVTQNNIPIAISFRTILNAIIDYYE
jgi:hypothetical protein